MTAQAPRSFISHRPPPKTVPTLLGLAVGLPLAAAGVTAVILAKLTQAAVLAAVNGARVAHQHPRTQGAIGLAECYAIRGTHRLREHPLTEAVLGPAH